jgi:membrane protein
MRTHATERNGLGGAIGEVTEHARRLARLEAELAATELREKAKRLGAGAGLGLAAALLALYGLGFLLATAAAALALALPTWLALLVVAGALLLLAGAAGALGASLVKRGTPPVPEQAVAEAKRTAEAVRG